MSTPEKTKKQKQSELKSKKRKSTIKKYLTNTLGGAALAATTAVPTKYGISVWKQRGAIGGTLKGLKQTGKIFSKDNLSNTGKQIGTALGEARKGVQPLQNIKDAAVAGTITGGLNTFIRDKWDKSKAKKQSTKAIDKAAAVVNKAIDYREKAKKNAMNIINKARDKYEASIATPTKSTKTAKQTKIGKSSEVKYYLQNALAEFAETDKPKVNTQSNNSFGSSNSSTSTGTPFGRLLDWKTKRKIVGATLKNHGRLQKQKFGKKLGKAKEGLGRAADSYGEIADIAKRRLSQIGTVAGVTGRGNVAALARKASEALERSKTTVPEKLRNTQSRVGQAKQAYDAISLAKNVGKGVVATGVVGGGLLLGSKTQKGKAVVDAAKNLIKQRQAVRAAKKIAKTGGKNL